MTKSNFLKEFCITTIFLQNFKYFRAELEYLKTFRLSRFQKKSTLQFISIQAIISHPQLMGSYHLLRAYFQNKTVIVGYFKI